MYRFTVGLCLVVILHSVENLITFRILEMIIQKKCVEHGRNNPNLITARYRSSHHLWDEKHTFGTISQSSTPLPPYMYIQIIIIIQIDIYQGPSVVPRHDPLPKLYSGKEYHPYPLPCSMAHSSPQVPSWDMNVPVSCPYLGVYSFCPHLSPAGVWKLERLAQYYVVNIKCAQILKYMFLKSLYKRWITLCLQVLSDGFKIRVPTALR